MTFFTEIEKSILNFIWIYGITRDPEQPAKRILKKQNKAGGLTPLVSKLTTKLQ